MQILMDEMCKHKQLFDSQDAVVPPRTLGHVRVAGFVRKQVGSLGRRLILVSTRAVEVREEGRKRGREGGFIKVTKCFLAFYPHSFQNSLTELVTFTLNLK